MAFQEISDKDRVWIFPSREKLEASTQEALLNNLDAFLQQWKAHGIELKSLVKIIEDRFVIIAVDESFEKASGCSIDSMVHFVQKLENHFNLNLADRSLVFYQNDEGEVNTVAFNRISGLVQNGDINPSTKVYNTHVSDGASLKKGWLMNAEDSWITRYFNKSTV